MNKMKIFFENAAVSVNNQMKAKLVRNSSFLLLFLFDKQKKECENGDHLEFFFGK